MQIKTKSELKGRKFKALRIVNGLSIDDIPAIRKNLQSQVDKIQGAKLTETDSAFELNSGQFFLKPVQPKEKIGVLECGSTFAEFDGVRIEYNNIELETPYNSFKTDNAVYAIHGEIN